jgi:predicted enzyme related to lactoylglutathione lyase
MTTETLNELAVLKGETFVWHECDVPDAEAAVDFYTKAFDFGKIEMDMAAQGQPGRKYHMLTRNGKPVAGIMGTDMPEMKGVPPHWSTFLGVDDVDARLKKCQELGATVVAGPMDLPEVGRMVLITDNQGAHIWLYKPAM